MMNARTVMIGVILILMPLAAFSASDHAYQSKYAGEEKRDIKSLSDTDTRN